MRHQYIVFFLGCIGLVKTAFSVSDEKAVRNITVFADGYDNLSRPAATTEVKIGLSLSSIDELDLVNHIFGASGWMIVKWMDERLTWDPATYGEIKSIVVPRSHIWTPDLALDSLFEDYSDFAEDSSNVRYDYTGKVLWKQWRNFKLYCQIGKDYMPDEKQNCTLGVVGSSNISEVSLGFIDTAIDIENIRAAVDYHVTETRKVSTTVVVTVDNETSFENPRLEFVIDIQRGYRSLAIFVLPQLLTLFLISLTFLIPFESGEKLSYIVGLYLSLTVLTTILLDEMPREYIIRNDLILIPALAMLVGAEVLAITVLLSMSYPKNDRNMTLKDLKKHPFIIRIIPYISPSIRHKIHALMKVHPSPSDATANSTEGRVLTTEHTMVTRGANTDTLTTADLKKAILLIERIAFINVVLHCVVYFIYLMVAINGGFF